MNILSGYKRKHVDNVTDWWMFTEKKSKFPLSISFKIYVCIKYQSLPKCALSGTME